MASISLYHSIIIKLFLAAILLVCLSDVYANDMKAEYDNAEDVETVEQKDHSGEETKFPSNDFDDDASLLSFQHQSFILRKITSDLENESLPFYLKDIFLPPPEM